MGVLQDKIRKLISIDDDLSSIQSRKGDSLPPQGCTPIIYLEQPTNSPSHLILEYCPKFQVVKHLFEVQLFIFVDGNSFYKSMNTITFPTSQGTCTVPCLWCFRIAIIVSLFLLLQPLFYDAMQILFCVVPCFRIHHTKYLYAHSEQVSVNTYCTILAI